MSMGTKASSGIPTGAPGLDTMKEKMIGSINNTDYVVSQYILIILVVKIYNIYPITLIVSNSIVPKLEGFLKSSYNQNEVTSRWRKIQIKFIQITDGPQFMTTLESRILVICCSSLRNIVLSRSFNIVQNVRRMYNVPLVV